MKFGQATRLMQEGKRVQREGWNGKGMFLFHVDGNTWDFTSDVDDIEGFETMPFICMRTADGKLVPWLASQTDVLAYDWQEY